MEKVLFTLILSSILLFSFESKSQDIFSKTGKFYPEVGQRSVLMGHIVNFKEFSDAPKEINLEVDDITIDNIHMFQTEINEKGDFEFDIPIYHSINTYLNYGNGRITPYIFPNDTLILKCEIEKEGYKFSITKVKFDSKNDKFQKDFSKLHEWLYYNQLNNFRDKLSKELTPEQFKTQLLDFEKVLLGRIKNRIENNSLNKTLADYLKFSASYSIYRTIIRESQKIESKQKRQLFLSFLTDSVVFKNEAMLTADYNTFLNSYNFALEPREGFGVETNGKTKEQVQWEMMNGLIENDFKRRDGIWAEYLGSTFIYNSLSQDGLTKPEISLYSKLIKEKFTENYIRQLLLSVCNKARLKNEDHNNLSIPTNAKLSQYDTKTGEEIFDRILKDNKEKVIYIDIWATWCSPCIKLFKHSNRMHEMLKNKDVEFVYLCCRSNEKNWKNIIKTHQLTGTHILLNQKQNDDLRKKLLINALPQFILVDSNGKIINKHAPKPDTEEILIEINKLHICFGQVKANT